MTIYITPNNKLHDDANGLALELPSWPKDARIATKEEIDFILNPQETPEQIISRLDNAIEVHIQSVIENLGYESLDRLVGVYSDSPNASWKAEALGAKNWVTALWETALQIEQDATNGTRPIPSEEELLSEMPKLADFVKY